MTISKAWLGGLAAAAAIVLAGCGGPGSSDTHSAPATHQQSTSSQPAHSPAHTGKSSEQTEKASITIDKFAYQVPSTVAPGATVTVTNKDTTTHTVTSDKGGLFTLTVSGGDTATFTAPDKPGDYPFHCKFHANMHGTLVVKK